MVLGYKQQFPDGVPTGFREKILNGVYQLGCSDVPVKIHSIRAGDRWRQGMSIQMAYGVRTSKYEQFNKDIKELSYCVSVQKISMDYDPAEDRLRIYIDGRKMSKNMAQLQLIDNDGLTRARFIEWFFSESTSFEGQIVHWTNYKYEDFT